MSGVNKAILVGNVGKDPEVRHLDNGRSVAKFPLATTERYKNKEGERVERTEWHNINMWSPLAEIAEKYIRKGSKLYVEGRIQTRNYEDASGNKKYFTEVEVRDMIMLDSRGEGTSDYEPSSGASTTSPESAPPVAEDEDDLPF